MTAMHDEGQIPKWTRGDRFRRARRSAGHENVQEFADLLGVGRNTISNVESDRTAPRRIVVKAWARACSVPETWLEYGETPPPSGDGASISLLPQLDSNQQPFDYTVVQLRAAA